MEALVEVYTTGVVVDRQSSKKKSHFNHKTKQGVISIKLANIYNPNTEVIFLRENFLSYSYFQNINKIMMIR